VHALGAEALHGERRGERRVDAARQAEHDARAPAVSMASAMKPVSARSRARR
jgi:hypothetical protein